MSDIVAHKTTAILAGATGYIGGYVLRALLEQGYDVISIGRTAPRLSSEKSVRHVECDLLQGPPQLPLDTFLRDRVVVISCLGSRGGGKKDAWAVEFGANKALLSFAQDLAAEHFVLLSAICVQKPKLEFQFAKLAFERKLISSGMCYSIVRPTAYFKSLSGQIENLRAGKSYLVFNSGKETACKPISGEDLAEFICICLTDISKFNKILPIGGPGPAITQYAQGEMLFEVIKAPMRIRKIPSGFFRVLSGLMAPFAVLSERLADKREFLRIGHYYATESMLLWDDESQRYAPELTPEYGEDRLYDFYKSALQDGLEGHDLGAHKLF